MRLTDCMSVDEQLKLKERKWSFVYYLFIQIGA